jgi:hypothetical protein
MRVARVVGAATVPHLGRCLMRCGLLGVCLWVCGVLGLGYSAVRSLESRRTSLDRASRRSCSPMEEDGGRWWVVCQVEDYMAACVCLIEEWSSFASTGNKVRSEEGHEEVMRHLEEDSWSLRFVFDRQPNMSSNGGCTGPAPA